MKLKELYKLFDVSGKEFPSFKNNRHREKVKAEIWIEVKAFLTQYRLLHTPKIGKTIPGDRFCTVSIIFHSKFQYITIDGSAMKN